MGSCFGREKISTTCQPAAGFADYRAGMIQMQTENWRRLWQAATGPVALASYVQQGLQSGHRFEKGRANWGSKNGLTTLPAGSGLRLTLIVTALAVPALISRHLQSQNSLNPDRGKAHRRRPGREASAARESEPSRK